jgi:pseudaminic acid biosynthesis-associated methylase
MLCLIGANTVKPVFLAMHDKAIKIIASKVTIGFICGFTDGNGISSASKSMSHDEHEAFWAGSFGDAYTDRNAHGDRTGIFARVLARTSGITSVTELGANVGLNLLAIRNLLPDCQLCGVEINQRAFMRLSAIEGISAYHASLLECSLPPADLSFTSGVLIHIAPEVLTAAYRKLYEASGRYVAMLEYYNPTPIEVPYRGHRGRLFKRDWAGDMMDMFPNLHLVDYGFFYRRAPIFAADDTNWFLLEKR